MSGIFGVWNLDEKPCDPKLLEDIGIALSHRGSDVVEHWRRGSVGLGARNFRETRESAFEIQPLVHSSGCVLVFDGRIDNRSELLKSFGTLSKPPQEWSDGEIFLECYANQIDNFAAKILGDFAAAIFDPRHQKIILIRDAVGVRPLYYFFRNNLFLFSSEVKGILVHPDVPRLPDDDSIADFMMGGLALYEQERTCFQNIFRVLPGEMITVSAQGLKKLQYWDFLDSSVYQPRSVDESTEIFKALFERAVKTRLRSYLPVAASVSGGLDSSSIFCLGQDLIKKEKGLNSNRETAPSLYGVSMVSRDGTPADEKVFIEDIEKARSLTIDRINIDELLGLFKGIEEQARHIEMPLLDFMWYTTRATQNLVKSKGARVLLTGHWGDQVMFSQHYLVDMFRKGRLFSVSRHLREFEHWFLKGETEFLKKQFLKNLIRSFIPEMMKPSLRTLRHKFLKGSKEHNWFTPDFRKRALRYQGMPPLRGKRFSSQHAQSLYLEVRSKYTFYSMEWNNKVSAMHGLVEAFPFMDRDLLSFLMGINGEYITFGGVPKRILREAMTSTLPATIKNRTWKADFTDLTNEGLLKEYDEIIDYFGFLAGSFKIPRVVSWGYVDGDILKKEISFLRSSIKGVSCTNTIRIADILGLEVFLNVFF